MKSIDEGKLSAYAQDVVDTGIHSAGEFNGPG